MNKKKFQKWISIGLIMTMLLALTACGNGDSSSGNGGSNGKPGGNKNGSADNSLAKQYVYSLQELDVCDSEDGCSIRFLTEVNDRVYALIEEYDWSAERNSSQNMLKLMSMKQDGTDVQTTEMQTWMNGESGPAEEAGDTDKAVPAESAENAENEKAEAAVEEVPVAEPMAIEGTDIYEYVGIGNCVIAPDGMIYGAKNYCKEDYSDPENIVSINNNYICCWNMDGVMQWELPMESLQTEDSYAYINYLIPMEDGSLLVWLSGEQTEKILIKDGQMSPRQPMNGKSEILNNICNLFVTDKGIVNLIYWDEADNFSTKLVSYDLNNDTMGEPVELPDAFSTVGYSAISVGKSTDLVYATNDGIYTFNIGDEQPVQIMSYINSDMAINGMNNILVLDETHFIGFYYDMAMEKVVGGYFTKVNPEDIPDKETLVIGGYYVDSDVKKRIVDFNKNSELYRFVVKEYQNYATEEDYMQGYVQLNNDIISGAMPDILVVDSSMQVDNYIAKGLLADVGSLMEKDEELSKTEFLDNVFEAYKVDGKLYHVIPSFYVKTLIGKKSIVGDRTTWTMQDLQDVMATLPEGTSTLGELTRGGFIYTMLGYCGSDFVDVATGKCNFDSPDFISMLEYAKNLPEELSEDYFGEDHWMNYQSQYRENRTILQDCYISEPRDLNRTINGYFGEEISYIGFPTESGKGSVIGANQIYVLSAKSANLDAAWQFVRYYLLPEYQKELSWQLPVDKAFFMNKVEEAMHNPYYFDENGEKIEYEDTFYMNNEEIPLPNMSQEQADQFVSFVESVDKCLYYNMDIQNIVEEEVAAFYEGQKSAQDVAAIIQSRAQIYVNENR